MFDKNKSDELAEIKNELSKIKIDIKFFDSYKKEVRKQRAFR